MFTEAKRERISDYYKATYWDYRMIWMNRRNPAIHAGYFDSPSTKHREALVRTNQVVADAVGIHRITEGSRILDAGCGLGASTIWLVENYPVEVHGISLSEDQIERAKRFATRRTVDDRAFFSVQDYTATRFPDGYFDVIWAIESVCYCDDTRDFMDEAYRLLKPGGTLVVWDGFRLSREISNEDDDLIRTILAGVACDDVDTVSEFTSKLESAGFSSVTFRDVGLNVEPSSERLYRLALLSGPICVVLRRLGLRSELAERNRKCAVLQGGILRKNLVTMGLVRACRT